MEMNFKKKLKRFQARSPVEVKLFGPLMRTKLSFIQAKNILIK